MNATLSDPVYPICVAAKLIGVHPRTLRLYEEEGLVIPSRLERKRYFSNNDITWIQCLRNLLHNKGLSIPGIKKLLALSPCWEIKECPPTKRENCSAYKDLSIPCWERAHTCSRHEDPCASCDVFLQHLAEQLGTKPC